MVFDIQRFSIHDGPGIRTTVFFKGCPLRCPWCHNPESWLKKPQVLFYANKCIGCGKCFEVCPVAGALTQDGERRINRDLCTDCGICTRTCYAQALALCGKVMTVDEVMAEVEKDRPFYETSDGGMTLSGGEPLMQPRFAIALLKAARAAGLHTVLDTCGYASRQVMEEAAQWTDLVLFDLKPMETARHRELVGVDNALIHDNLRRLTALGVPVRIRVPVIPGCTDTPDHIRAVVALLASLSNVQQVDLMRYHRLGESKWKRLGRAYPLEGTQPPSDDVMNGLKALAESARHRVTVHGGGGDDDQTG